MFPMYKGLEFSINPDQPYPYPFVYWKPLNGYTLANSEDPDEMQQNAAFHQGLHCLLRLKQHSGTDLHQNYENSTCDPLKYTMGIPILIVSICMGKSIRIQRGKNQADLFKHFEFLDSTY